MNSLELCNTTNSGYKVVDGTSLILDGNNCQEKLKELVRKSTADEYVFYSKRPTISGYFTECKFEYSGKVELKYTYSASASLLVYNKDCTEELKNDTIKVEETKEVIDTKEYESKTMILGITIFSAVILVGLATFITLFCLKRRGMICFNKNSKNQEIIVHQNELYGNLSNDDYFAERYDTNIVDTNQYYEEEYEA